MDTDKTRSSAEAEVPGMCGFVLWPAGRRHGPDKICQARVLAFGFLPKSNTTGHVLEPLKC